MSPSHVALRIVAIVAWVVLSVPPLHGQEAVRQAPDFEDVPRPPLDAVEPAVAAGLVEKHDALDALLRAAESEQGVDGLALAQAYAELGLSYHAHAFLDAARAAYRNAAALVPADPRWPHAIGLAEVDAGDSEAAAVAFERALTVERALAVDPSSPSTRLQLAEVRLSQGRLDDADALVRRVLEDRPNEPAALAARGRIALERRDYRVAVDSLEAALSRVPDAGRLHYPLALAYRGLGELDAARRHLEQRGSVGLRTPDPIRAAIEERKSGVRAMILRGRRAFDHGRWAEAADAFARAVAVDPKNNSAQVNLGAALVATGDLDGAEEAFRAALEIQPANAETHYNLGRLALLRGEHDVAVASFRRALESDPDDVESRRRLAVALQLAGSPDEAIDELGRVVAAAPLDEEAHLARAQLLVDRGRVGEAAEALRAALEALPQSDRIAQGLARVEQAIER